MNEWNVKRRVTAKRNKDIARLLATTGDPLRLIDIAENVGCTTIEAGNAINRITFGYRLIKTKNPDGSRKMLYSMIEKEKKRAIKHLSMT